MKLFTGRGDDGSTSTYFGERVAKDDPRIRATGSLDEAQAAIGLARAEAREQPNLAPVDIDELLIQYERDLWVIMAETNAPADARDRLETGKSLSTQPMVDAIEKTLEKLSQTQTMPSEFVVPGQNRASASLEFARTIVRRAERECHSVLTVDSPARAYLNRLSSVLWALARICEDTTLTAKHDKGEK